MKLDNGIVSVLTSLDKLKFDEYDISYDTKQLADKLSPENNRTLYQMVKNQVIDNYLTIQKIIINLDKQGKIDYEEIQYQMRSRYKKLKAAKHDNLAIFNTISEKIIKLHYKMPTSARRLPLTLSKNARYLNNAITK